MIQRYEPDCLCDEPYSEQWMTPDDLGRYIEYAEYEEKIKEVESQRDRFNERLTIAIQMLARNTGMPFSEVWLTVADAEEHQ